VDVFFMTLERGAEVIPESHPFSERWSCSRGSLRARSKTVIRSRSVSARCDTRSVTGVTTFETSGIAALRSRR
jgi:hypothetical protein